MTLDNVPINKTVIINKINTNQNIKRRLLDLGLTNNTQITPLYKSPLNDPTSYLIKGSVIALRQNDTKNIIVSLSDNKNCGDIDGTN